MVSDLQPTEKCLTWWLLDHSACIIQFGAKEQSSGEIFNFFIGNRGVGEGSWF